MAKKPKSLLSVAILLSISLLGFSACAQPMSTDTGPEVTEVAEASVRLNALKSAATDAEEHLTESYGALLERKELGYSRALNDIVQEDLSEAAAFFQKQDRTELARTLGLPLGVILILMLLLALMDRQLQVFVFRKQAQIGTRGNPWVTQLARATISIAGRVVPAVALLILTYFPVRAVFGTVPWTEALTEIVGVLILYRLLHGVVVSSFGYRLIELKDEAADRLMIFGIWAVRVFAYWSVANEIVRAYEYRPEFASLLNTVLLLSIAVLAVSLLPLKSDVVEMLSLDGAPADQQFTALADRYYYPAIALTVLFLILGCFGYDAAAQFVLVRGYGAVVIIFASLRIGKWVRSKIDGMVAEAATTDETELFQSIGTFLRVAYMGFLVWFVLLALKLLGPLLTVLTVPLLVIGTTSIPAMAFIDAILFLATAVLIGKVLRAVLLTRVFPVLNVDVGVGYAINTLVNYAIIVLGVIVALAALGIDFSSLTVLVASLGVGIGLGLQALTENLVSGFILLFGRSVKKGDVVTVADVYGQVEEVGARSVIIRTPDNYDMLIPSKQLVNGQVINWSYRDSFVRLHMPVGVTYSANPREVEKVLLAAAREHKEVRASPKPEVWLTGFGNSSVDFELLVFFDTTRITLDRLRGQLYFIIWDKLAEAEIEIPFPQRDLHLRTGPFFEDMKGALEAYQNQRAIEMSDIDDAEPSSGADAAEKDAAEEE